MLDGKVAEMGSYAELMAAEGALAKLVQEHVSESHHPVGQEADQVNTEQDEQIKHERIDNDRIAHDEAVAPEKDIKKASTASEGALMLKEERETGAVVSRHLLCRAHRTC